MDASAAKLDTYRKIDDEKAIIHAADHMRHETDNVSVNAQLESQIRNTEHFQQTLQELQIRKINENPNVLEKQDNESQLQPSQGHEASFGFGDYTEQGLSVAEHDSCGISGAQKILLHQASYTAPGAENRPPRPYQNYSGLDLTRNDADPPLQDLITPHTACHQNAVSHTGSGQSSSDFLHSKEKLLAMNEQAPLETSFGRSIKQKPEQPLQDTIAPASTEREKEFTAPCVRTENRVGLDHFNFLAVLGKGNFAKIMLAESKTTKQLYAIKVLKKELVIQNNEVKSICSEKRVLLIANKGNHPFLVNFYACFQTETRICFVIEYISGGDLMFHIQREPFGINRTKFYAAEVCLALKYFHENGIVYRGLKLDDILLALDGHIKVADFGLCKENMWYQSTTSTFCGTSEFMAPEILLDQEYGRAVDWWSFGIIVYQMLLQQPPFRGEDEDEIYDAILEDEPFYPDHMPQDSVSILQKLLTRQPALRLGSGPADAQEVMSHAFFHDFNWEDVYHKRIPAPYLPKVNSRGDTSNFDADFTTKIPALTPVQSVLTQAMQEEFRNFSYSTDFV